MRVLIDLQWMKPGHTGGVEFQARLLLNTLLQIDSVNQYHLLLPYAVRRDYKFKKSGNFHPFFLGEPRYYFSRLLDEAARHLKIPRQNTRERYLSRATSGVDVALSITGYTAPALRFLPTVLNVPDIQHEFLPELFPPNELARRKEYYRLSIESAKHICAMSDFTRQTLIDRLGVPEEKITVTHLAPDPIFNQACNVKEVQETCRRYRLSHGNYLFFPAATWRHKNHRAAILALHQFNQLHHTKLELVFSGPHKEAFVELQKLVNQLQMQEQVRFLGFVPRAHLPSLYSGAAALIFPSLFEGFGMPVLEAMAIGCPVICSNTTSLPEIAGDAAFFFDPSSVDAIVCGIEAILQNPETREMLIQKGYQRASQFSWMDYTTKTLSILQQVGNST